MTKLQVSQCLSNRPQDEQKQVVVFGIEPEEDEEDGIQIK